MTFITTGFNKQYTRRQGKSTTIPGGSHQANQTPITSTAKGEAYYSQNQLVEVLSTLFVLTSWIFIVITR